MRAAATEQNDPKPMTLGPVKLLVVDDTPENLLAMEAVLRRPEYEIITASSGEEALKFLLGNDCALILMDVQMPSMDGVETARLIRSNERTRPIPIVFMTAWGRDERSVARGYGIGGVDYLLKPIDPDILKAKVAAFVEMYRAKGELVRHAEQLRDRERAERQRALAELELSGLRRQELAQQRYRRLIEGITHAIVWTVDPVTLACTFVSPSAEQILGYPLGAWLASPTFWKDLIPRHEQSRVAEALASMTPGAETVPVQHGFVAADGRVARFRTELCLVEADDDSKLSVRGFSVDITDMTRADEALAFLDLAGADLARSLDLESTVATAAHATVPFLADWCVVDVRPAPHSPVPLTFVAHADQGCEEEEVRRLAALPELAANCPGSRAEIVGDLAARLAQAAPGALPSSIAPAWMIAIPLIARGRPLGAIRLFRRVGRAAYGAHELRIADELGRRAAQAIDNALLYAEAREAIRVREEFLSIASHEVRTPLTPLKLQAQLVERLVTAELPAGRVRAEILKRLGTCVRQVDRMTRLVSNLLDVARLRAGRFDLEIVECDLRDLAVEVAGRFADELSGTGRRIDLRVNGAVVGRWDRARLDQVLTNLVSNAVRYGGEKPIAVSCSHDEDKAVFTVSDQGPGIGDQDLERIFERFESGENSRSHGGLGLGLYISRCLVEAHGGRIAVSSTIGAGSTFTVELPLEQPPRAV